MNNIIKYSLIFIAGASVGSLVAYKFAESKFSRLANDEINAVREYYRGKNEKNIEDACKCEDVNEKEIIEDNIEKDRESYNDIIYQKEYIDVPEEDKKILEDMGIELDDDDTIEKREDGSIYLVPDVVAVVENNSIVVIAPEEFGELESYKTLSWTYYSDFTLVDQDGEIISDPERFIGDALEHFGDYEDDSVHVLNDGLQTYYEILKDPRSFAEAYSEGEK